ncbi:VapC toxin family PIN domain ribonuclease [Bifidobacterium primatium]|uniref:Ribonuclease VapC n=1 Tax=Bifidobacterium primatium TaxID=2045438 RepID=A0A2M9HB60_9BIFI|nr:type II toxin-antitoxin system VapC family toxin [Bifidobacterium primatium]PJM74056.1 VapC toxin family PIN domain ribonuclease [Bifidobacterium primatium]
MIVVDTNVVSELWKARPDTAVMRWWRSQDLGELMITSITVAELYLGVRLLPEGRKRERLAAVVKWFCGDFVARTADFDIVAALNYSRIMAERRRMGRPIGVQDAMIAAMARSRGAAVATRNVKNFEGTGVDVVNPWGSTAE